MMHIGFKYVLGYLVVAFGFLIAPDALTLYDRLCPSGRETLPLTPPFKHIAGQAFSGVLPSDYLDFSDNPAEPARSNLIVCEGNFRLEPGHSAHKDIADHGKGGYSHWGRNVIFSTSDGTDPNTNGRSYWTVRPSK